MVDVGVISQSQSFSDSIMRVPVVGRRKSSSVRVHFRPGKGNITVNGRAVDDYFKVGCYQHQINRPLVIAKALDPRFASVDVFCNAIGGGTTGQAEAIRLALSRKIVELNISLRLDMRTAGLLTCDSRKVESKHYGRKKARKRFQYAKR